MANQQSELDIIVRTRDETTASLKQIQSSVIRFVGAVSSILTVFGGVVFPIKQAAEFQQELLNVQKTTDFTATQINQLSRSLRTLSTNIDLTAVDLAKIAGIAGQLGLGSSGVRGIEAFTETTARFASVIDVSVEQAAAGLAKLVNIFKVPVTEVERLSSLLNELSNNSTASGEELIDIIQRIGTAGGTLSATQSATLAALGRDVGLTVETVGTSFQKIFLRLQTQAPQVAALIGQPVEEFTELLRTDGIAALKLYLTGLTQLPAQIRAATAEQITGGGRIFGLVQNLLNDAENGFQLLNARLANATEGFEGGTSAIREQQRVMQGFTKQLALARNNFLNLAIAIGQQALPYLTDLARQVQAGLADPRFVAQVKAMAASIGEFGKSVIGALRFLFSLRDHFGIVLRVVQVLLALNLVSFFFNQARGLLEMARNARLAAQAFIALATGQKRAVASGTAAQAAATAGSRAAQLTPGLAVASAVGRLPAANRVNQQTALAAQNDLLAAQARHRASIAAQARVLANAQAELARQLTAESAIIQRIAAVRSGAAQGNLRSLQAQHQAILLNIAAERQNLSVIQQRTAARIAERNAAVGVAATVAAQTAAEAAGGLPRLVQRSFTTGLAAAGGALLALGRRIVSLVLPAALWISVATGLISLIAGIFGKSLDDVFEGVARLLGLHTARREAALSAQLAAEAAEKEAEAVSALSDEYQKAKAVIESFRPGQIEQALSGGAGSDFLRKTSNELRLVQARLAQNAVDLKHNEENQRAVTEELTRGNLSYERQSTLLNAAVGLTREQAELQAEIPRLQEQQLQRAQALSKFYDLDAKLLTKQLEVIASTREELGTLETERERQLAQTGKVDPVLEQRVSSSRAALQTLERAYAKARDSATRVGLAFVDSLDPKASSQEIRKVMTELSRIGAGVTNEVTRAAERTAGEALVREIEGKSRQILKLRELEKVQKQVSEAARRQADDYKAAWERASNDAQAAIRKSLEVVAKAQEAIKSRAQRLLLADFDTTEKRAQEFARRQQEQILKKARKGFEEQGLNPEEIELAEQQLRDQLDAQEEQRQRQADINRLQKEYNAELQRAKKAQFELTAEESLQKRLAEQINDARTRGDTGGVQNLTDQLAASRARSEQVLETLTKIQDKIGELRDTTLEGGLFTDAAQPIDVQKANVDIALLGQSIKEGTIAAAEASKNLSEAAEVTAKDLAGAFSETSDQLKTMEQRLLEIGKAIGLTLGDFAKIGEQLRVADGQGQNLQRTILATLQGDYSNSNLANALRQIFELRPNPALIQQQMSEATRNLEIDINKLSFPGAKESLQNALNAGEPVTANVRVNPAGGRGFAGGGQVSGPGTSTSDSILARLSSGEYVSDARTVQAFGPGFFATLKSISRRGGSAVASFMANFASGMPMPAFAGGGFVGSATRPQSAGTPGAMDIVRFELDVGGSKVQMVGEREQAQKLVRALRNVSRGV